MHLLNASATLTHWLALPGHEFTVLAMDGNPVPVHRHERSALRLAPAERIDVAVEMNRPGVWILGETRAALRKMRHGHRWWNTPSSEARAEVDRAAGDAVGLPPLRRARKQLDERSPMSVSRCSLNRSSTDTVTSTTGRSMESPFPKTDTIALQEGKRYRLVMTNQQRGRSP